MLTKRNCFLTNTVVKWLDVKDLTRGSQIDWLNGSKQHKEVVFERCYFFLVFDLDKVAIEVLLKIFKWYEAHAWKKISDVHFEICGLFVA